MDGQVLYLNKDTQLLSSLGYKQVGSEGFNMSFAIDGTKDTCKLVIQNYDENVVLPFTIIQDSDTNTWWCVSHDKVSRYQNEGNSKYYIHELTILGAFELLNVRDLTDSGFNNYRYTFESFIKRLFNHSTCESWLKNITIDYQANIDKDIMVDYLKTFENYTLASAIREFLDGYNLCPKLEFYLDNGVYKPKLVILSKTGSTNSTPIDIETFSEVRENKTIDKNSYGTTVVSNAENVVSTKTKVYPTAGFARFSADAHTITKTNALIRLPSKISEVKNVKMYNSKTIIRFLDTGSSVSADITFNPLDRNSINEALDEVENYILNATYYSNEGLEDFESKRDNVANSMYKAGELVFNNTIGYDPISDSFEGTQNSFHKPQGDKDWVLGSKTLRDGVLEPRQVMYWEKGGTTINGFDFFDYWHISGHSSNVIQSNAYPRAGKILWKFTATTPDQQVVGFSVSLYGATYDLEYITYDFTNVIFVVEYVPMSDLKIKIDNGSVGIDAQLYNQNGKLTDSNALSKLLLSYSKEIESDTITRYKNYYVDYTPSSFSSVIPKVGDVVVKTQNNETEYYVINNVSLQFYANESISYSGTTPNKEMGYYIEGEFTMSKQIGVKSMLTNPNTNIRDYGIPQNNNVKRKQLYRDFVEFGATREETGENAYRNWFFELSRIMNVGLYQTEYNEHKAFIKTTFENADVWYYQLDTTTYVLKKSIYEIVDFQDNNIIGYDMQTILSGFDITRILSGLYDSVNTPVSYVDENGEVKDIELCFVPRDRLSYPYGDNPELAYHCFIDSDTYDRAQASRDMNLITENDYDKDALEVPVFEYSCQIDDSEDIIVGENLFDTKITFEKKDYDYTNFLYSYVLVPKNKVNQNNAYNYDPSIMQVIIENQSPREYGYQVETDDSGKNGAVIFTWARGTEEQNKSQKLVLTFYDSLYLLEQEQTYETTPLSGTIDFANYDIVVFRHNIWNRNVYKTDLFMIIKNASKFDKTSDTLTLIANRYKLK